MRSGTPVARAISTHDRRLTACARILVSRPAVERGKRGNSACETAMLSTLSPRNARRSYDCARSLTHEEWENAWCARLSGSSSNRASSLRWSGYEVGLTEAACDSTKSTAWPTVLIFSAWSSPMRMPYRSSSSTTSSTRSSESASRSSLNLLCSSIEAASIPSSSERCARISCSTSSRVMATRWSVPRPRARGGAADRAGQGHRVKPMLVAWASPRTKIQRRGAAAAARAWSWDRPSLLQVNRVDGHGFRATTGNSGIFERRAGLAADILGHATVGKRDRVRDGAAARGTVAYDRQAAQAEQVGAADGLGVEAAAQVAEARADQQSAHLRHGAGADRVADRRDQRARRSLHQLERDVAGEPGR